MTKAEFCSNEFPIARFMQREFIVAVAMKFTRKDSVFYLSICCPQRKAL